MEETKVKTLSETYCLLKHFPKAYIEKIPPKILELINHFSDSKYYIDIDTEKTLEEQEREIRGCHCSAGILSEYTDGNSDFPQNERTDF